MALRTYQPQQPSQVAPTHAGFATLPHRDHWPRGAGKKSILKIENTPAEDTID